MITIEASLAIVHPLPLDFDAPLSRVVREIVHGKYLLDAHYHEKGGSMLAGHLHDHGYGPAEPLPFLARILPFFELAEERGERRYALAPTAHTLGCSWRWRGRGLTGEEATQRKAKLTDVEALLNGSLDKASYIWVEPLGIIAPCEGKNRVDFLRELEVDYIPAEVTPTSYPQADRIKIYKVRSQGHDRVSPAWAVLDGRWLQRIENPAWTLPLLQAYGVKVGNWPAELPGPATVMAGFLELRLPNSALAPKWSDTPTVDLALLAKRREYQLGRIPCSFLELEGVKLAPNLLLRAAGTAVLATSALIAMPATWSIAMQLVSFVLGLVTCILLLPTAECLVAKRECVKDKMHLPIDQVPAREA